MTNQQKPPPKAKHQKKQADTTEKSSPIAIQIFLILMKPTKVKSQNTQTQTNRAQYLDLFQTKGETAQW